MYPFKSGRRSGEDSRQQQPRTSAAVVRWVFQTYTTKSVGCKEIARRLQGRGISLRRSSRWAFTGVRGILVNSICTGRIAYNQRRFKIHKQTGRRVAVRKDEGDHLVQQGRDARYGPFTSHTCPAMNQWP